MIHKHIYITICTNLSNDTQTYLHFYYLLTYCYLQEWFDYLALLAYWRSLRTYAFIRQV